MIAKHVSIRSIGKSNFAHLVAYLTDSQSKEHRVGAVRLTNVHAFSAEDAVSEVLATQYSNTRAQADKTYHLVVSFRAGEHPAPDVLMAIEDRLCAGLGFEGHQRVSVVHNDTDNLHVHVAINKIHPERLTIHEPYYSHQKLGELCTTLESEFGLAEDNHISLRRGAASRARDMERHSGIESLLGWIARECLPELQAARSWEEFYAALDANGLKLNPRGNGFVVTADDGTSVKASSIGREFSKARLIDRFGPLKGDLAPSDVSDLSPGPDVLSTAETLSGALLQPPAVSTLSSAERNRVAGGHYRKRPIAVRVDTGAMYVQYQAEQDRLKELWSAGIADIRGLYREDIKSATRAYRLRRSAVRLMGDGRDNKRILYRQAHAALQRDIDAIKKRARVDSVALQERTRLPLFRDWVRNSAGSLTMKLDTVEMFKRFQEDQLKSKAERQAGLAVIRADLATSLQAQRHAWETRRAEIRASKVPYTDKKVLYKEARAAFLGKADAARASARDERESLAVKTRLSTWADWLQKEALQGDSQALQTMRLDGVSQAARVNAIRGRGDEQERGAQPLLVVDTVTKSGTVLLRGVEGAIKDDGQRLQVSNGASDAAVREALLLAAQKYGPVISIQGTVEFKAQVIAAAAVSQLPINFADSALEARRVSYLKRVRDEQREQSGGPHHDGRRGSTRRPDGADGGSASTLARNSTAARRSAGDAQRGDAIQRGAGRSGSEAAKPHVARVGTRPPPESRNRLRTMSALGVVSIAPRSEVLLPGDVSRDLEHKGTERVTSVRRDVVGNVTPEKAMEKYIAEREGKRAAGIDIPKHCRYTDGSGKLLFQGLRRIEGHALALLRRHESPDVMVLPVDEATAQRLSRVKVGAEISKTERGSLRTTGIRKGKTR